MINHSENIRNYIEANVELIERGAWKEFFKAAPAGSGEPLYEAGIPFMKELGYVPHFAFSDSKLTSIEIPDNVTSIDTWAFSGCTSLKSVTIPDSVTSIQGRAFKNCKYIDITYLGLKQEWKNLVTGKDIFKETTYVCQCSDGVVKKTR